MTLCIHGLHFGAGEMVRQPYGQTVHGSVPNDVVRLNVLYVSHIGPVSSDGVPKYSEFLCTFVMVGVCHFSRRNAPIHEQRR